MVSCSGITPQQTMALQPQQGSNHPKKTWPCTLSHASLATRPSRPSTATVDIAFPRSTTPYAPRPFSLEPFPSTLQGAGSSMNEKLLIEIGILKFPAPQISKHTMCAECILQESKILVLGPRILDPGSRFLHPGSRIQDGSRILDPGSKVQDLPEAEILLPFLELFESPALEISKEHRCAES